MSFETSLWEIKKRRAFLAGSSVKVQFHTVIWEKRLQYEFRMERHVALQSNFKFFSWNGGSERRRSDVQWKTGFLRMRNLIFRGHSGSTPQDRGGSHTRSTCTKSSCHTACTSGVGGVWVLSLQSGLGSGPSLGQQLSSQHPWGAPSRVQSCNGKKTSISNCCLILGAGSCCSRSGWSRARRRAAATTSSGAGWW